MFLTDKEICEIVRVMQEASTALEKYRALVAELKLEIVKLQGVL